MTEEQLSGEDELQKKIVDVLSEHKIGATNEIVFKAFPNMTTREEKQQLVNCLNKLITQNKIQLLQKGNKIVYKLKESSTQRYQGTDFEEKLIFEAIERVGNNGIASKDLKVLTKMTIPQINKILKSLEEKKMVKCVTSTAKKKLFLLYNLEPSHSITGGTFYSGEEFESEFVDVLAEQCYKYLVQAKILAEKQLSDPIARRNASFKSAKDISDYINGLKISKVNLSLKDIEKILESLVYDEKVEKLTSLSKNSSKASETLYRCSRSLIDSAALMMVPCGVCKVFMDCHVNGEVSPATCIYMKDWLEF